MQKFVITTKEDLSQLIETSVRKALEEDRERQPSTEAQPLNEIVFLEEAMQITGLAKPTIYAKTSKGEIPHYKRSRKLYFKRTELLRWIEEGRQ
ncbi:MAG: helix-turn-helix domain-containing protein [Bacteroidota bacterium]